MYHAVHGVLSYLECNLIILVIGYKLKYNVAYYVPKRSFDSAFVKLPWQTYPLGFLVFRPRSMV